MTWHDAVWPNTSVYRFPTYQGICYPTSPKLYPEVDSSKARWYSGWKLCSRGSFIPRRRDARGRGLASLPVCGVTFLPSLRICLTHPLNTRGPLTHLKNSIVGM